MTNDIVKHQPAAPAPRPGGALSLASMTPHDAWKFAEALAGSGMLPRQYQGNPASVLWALEYGRAIGLDVITTTQSVHVIQGRATASADLMASLTRRAGHRMRISGDDDRAEVIIFRADDPEFPFTAVWDTAKATRAKLTTKDTWKQFPGAMLRARAISECVRMACPEVLHGSIYTPEEIGANVDSDGVPVDAPVQPIRAVRDEPVPQQGTGQLGNMVVDRESFQPYAPAQEIAAKAAKATTREEVTACGTEARTADVSPDAGVVAPDTNEPDTLRQYLARRWRDLPKKATGEQPDEGVVDGEIVLDRPAEDKAASDAEAELRAFAAEHGIDDIARDAEAALGMPLDLAPADAIRGLLAQLRGTAA